MSITAFKRNILFIIVLAPLSFALSFINYDPDTTYLPQWVGCMLVMCLAIPLCNYIAFKLVPRYLYNKKIRRFITYLLLLTLANTLATYVISLFIYHLLTGHHMFRSVLYFSSLSLEIFLVDIVLVVVIGMIKIITDRFFMEQKILEIEKEKVSTELNFLRSQVNPHFLFNVMNTIYFQIEKSNVDARLSVEKLSEMLRYQLYECNTDKIQIHKELLYIQNYVAIQTLRMEKDSDIRLFIDNEMENFLIAPLLILPIVENAFKHVSNFKDAGKNKIHLTIKKEDKNTFLVEAINTFDQANGQKYLIQSGGLGIQNLQRRLELLYPGRHELNINKNENTFQTVLKLQYND